jgi:hypothetical protein
MRLGNSERRRQPSAYAHAQGAEHLVEKRTSPGDDTWIGPAPFWKLIGTAFCCTDEQAERRLAALRRGEACVLLRLSAPVADGQAFP